MIRVRASYDATPIEEIAHFVDSFNDLVEEVGNEAYLAVEDGLVRELRFQPPRRSWPGDYPIEWTSEKQRKAYFATNGFGGGIPYERKGRASKSWIVEDIRSPGKFEIKVSSSWKDAEYVYGTLNMRSLREAKLPQQRYHQITGWVAAAETVRKWFDVSDEEFRAAFDRIIDRELGKYIKKRRSRR